MAASEWQAGPIVAMILARRDVGLVRGSLATNSFLLAFKSALNESVTIVVENRKS
jgi:hypothetical protein